eukprot:gb/GECG01000374.1/.p1 GENE.gb/GECG01000374.1/~~gb/GECG01000374.1/.p1  ORF type:complete len:201 (+),score=37.18 gb/GECG01000374.1/:1-603(+)
MAESTFFNDQIKDFDPFSVEGDVEPAAQTTETSRKTTVMNHIKGTCKARMKRLKERKEGEKENQEGNRRTEDLLHVKFYVLDNMCEDKKHGLLDIVAQRQLFRETYGRQLASEERSNDDPSLLNWVKEYLEATDMFSNDNGNDSETGFSSKLRQFQESLTKDVQKQKVNYKDDSNVAKSFNVFTDLIRECMIKDILWTFP